MKLGDPSAQMNVETIPTGSLSLDIALGLGGIPKGYTDILGIDRVKGMLRINEPRYASPFLYFGNHMQGNGRESKEKACLFQNNVVS